MWFSFPQMIVNGTSEMTDSRGAGFVFSNAAGGYEVLRSPDLSFGSLRGRGRSGLDCGRNRCGFRAGALGCIVAEGDCRVEERKAVLQNASWYSRL